jgi:hypothetical protein
VTWQVGGGSERVGVQFVYAIFVHRIEKLLWPIFAGFLYFGKALLHPMNQLRVIINHVFDVRELKVARASTPKKEGKFIGGSRVVIRVGIHS